MRLLAQWMPSDITFDRPYWVHFLWIVAAIALFGGLGIWQRRRGLQRFAGGPLLARLSPPLGWVRPLLRLTLVTLALTSAAIAAGGPRWGAQEQTIIRRNIDVMVLLDVSRSMLARDLSPDRMTRAKIAISDDLLPALGGDRVGLITFAGDAVLKVPLTSDYGFLRLALDDVDTNSARRGGTLIGDAIRKAADAFQTKLETHKVIILITDGEDHDSFPVEAARTIWEKQKIPIVAVALGDEREGARVPLEEGASDYVRYQGQVVWSKANFDDLRRIAGISNLNIFLPVGTKNFDLGEIYRERIVPAIKYQQQFSQERVQRPARYHPFAVVALGLLLLESLLRDGPGRPRSASASQRAVEEAA